MTSVTKRNNGNKSKLGTRRNNVTPPPLGGCYVTHAPDLKKTPERLVDLKAAVDAAFLLAADLRTLKVEVLAYLDGYTSRGMRSEGLALARLRKAVTGNSPAPSPGSPGSPERAAEQRIRNERATRMAEAVSRSRESWE